MSYDVAVIGLGRVGLPLAITFADHGLSVLGVDKDAERLATVGAGKMPFKEPDTEAPLARAVESGALRLSELAADAAQADAIVLTLGTPTFSHIEIDMSDIRTVLDTLLPHLREGQLLVLRSTVAPHTTEFVAGYLEKRRGFRIGEDLFVAHVPERIAADRFMAEIGTLPCIVGGVGAGSGDRAAALFAPARRPGRADHARPGRAGQDLGEHPALRHVRAPEPPDDGLRALRRERVRGDRPDQPRLPARRHRAAGLHRRHLPAQGLRVLRGAVQRAGHAARRLARPRERPAVPRGGHQAAARRPARPQGRRARARLQGRHGRRARLAVAQAHPACSSASSPTSRSTTPSSPRRPRRSRRRCRAPTSSSWRRTTPRTPTPDALAAIARHGAGDCLVVDPWNAFGAAQVFGYASEIAALSAYPRPQHLLEVRALDQRVDRRRLRHTEVRERREIPSYPPPARATARRTAPSRRRAVRASFRSTPTSSRPPERALHTREHPLLTPLHINLDQIHTIYTYNRASSRSTSTSTLSNMSPQSSITHTCSTHCSKPSIPISTH